MKLKLFIVSLVIICLTIVGFRAQAPSVSNDTTKLAVVWSSGDPEVAEKVCFMYTHAAKRAKWFDEVVLIVWGPSAKLLSENEMLQKKIQSMAKDGVKIEACIACASMYGQDVVEKLKDLGIDVKGMGTPLSNYLKNNWKTLTF